MVKKKKGKRIKALIASPLHPKQNPCSSLNLNFNTIYLYAQQRLLSIYMPRYMLGIGSTQSMPIVVDLASQDQK